MYVRAVCIRFQSMVCSIIVLLVSLVSYSVKVDIYTSHFLTPLSEVNRIHFNLPIIYKNITGGD